jgi:SAM-dependent methyltransferase
LYVETASVLRETTYKVVQMLRTIWRQFLADRVTRAVSARSAPGIDAKIASLEQKVLALVAASNAGAHTNAERSTTELKAVVEMIEVLRSDLRSVSASVSGQSGVIAAHGQAITAMGPSIRATIDETAALSAIARMEKAQPALERLFVPPIGLSFPTPGPFMEWSTCSAADFIRPDFQTICGEIGLTPSYHRKHWEWVFIVHHLRRLGMLALGKKGIVFGVGLEHLPSLFAKLGADVMATDAPQEIGEHWSSTGQFTAKLNDLHLQWIVDEEAFRRHVSYATCDMNAIGDEFTGYDFCWSSCCFEHLGNLQAGLDFVVNSVEKTLKPGGVAVHTTEFNLSSNEATVESGDTVIYRKRDIEGLVQRLRDRGHEVDEFRIAPDHHPLDFYVDLPPYQPNPHLRLKLFGFTSTSVGLVIRRGA